MFGPFLIPVVLIIVGAAGSVIVVVSAIPGARRHARWRRETLELIATHSSTLMRVKNDLPNGIEKNLIHSYIVRLGAIETAVYESHMARDKQTREELEALEAEIHPYLADWISSNSSEL